MNRKTLEEKCIERFGKNGRKLFRVMTQIADKDFCVATAWNERQVSIARSCNYIGKIFLLSDNYKSIKLGSQFRPIKYLRYEDISAYLSNSRNHGEVFNCQFDRAPAK